MLLAPHRKLVFIGDSVTDCGRARPIGEGWPGSLGNGYVAFLDAFLAVTRPNLNLRTINMGTSGHTVRDLKARWQSDVLDLEPDYVACMIGINDVWRQFDSPLRPETHVLPDEFRITLDYLLETTVPRVERFFLATPFFVEPNRHDPMRARADEYGLYVKEAAELHGAVFVDVQGAFDALNGTVTGQVLAGDRVHPSPLGSAVIARAFAEAMGVIWPR